jgi:diguanylate cyclase (GGDEF)-like protein
VILLATGVPRPLAWRVLGPQLILFSPLLYQDLLDGDSGVTDIALLVALIVVAVALTLALFGTEWLLNAVERASRHDASTDPLTLLPNRRRFTRRLERMLAEREAGNPAGLAVVMLDLDNFGDVNSVYGHQIGDALLCEIGDALRAVVREGDLIARVGGDEFAAILNGVGADAAQSLSERFVRAVIECTSHVDDGTIARVTASAGYALYPAQGSTIDELIARADDSLMQVKEGGKNAVQASRFTVPR